MIQRQHRVRFTATKIGLQLHHRVAALAGQALHAAHQQPLQAFRQKRAPKKLHRFAVFIAAFAQMHLPQVSGKLGLLVTSARHVGMRRNHLAPRFKHAGRCGLDQRAARLALFATHLLIHRQPAQFRLDAVDLVGLRRGDSRKQTRHRVERAVGVVAAKWLLVRPFVALITQLLHQTALGTPQRFAEDCVPRIPHYLEQCRHIPLSDGLFAIQAVFTEKNQRLTVRLVLISRLELALDIGAEAGLQQIHRLAHTLVIGNCHGSPRDYN